MARRRKYILVIIDMQPEFVAAKNNRKLIRKISREIDKAIRLGNHIVFVNYKGYGRTTRALTRAVNGYPNISRVSKSWTDGGRVLFRHLSEVGLSHLKVCGIETNVCVSHTVFTLATLYPSKFDIEILQDCCDALSKESHDHGIHLMQQQKNVFVNGCAA